MKITVDNFRQLSSFMEFPDDDVFYNVQLIVRRKDHPDRPEMKSQQMIHMYYIDRPGKLEELEGEIKALCREAGARAYLSVCPKSYRAMAFQMSEQLLERIKTGNFRKCHHVAESAAGVVPGFEKWWLLDIDEKIDDRDPAFIDALESLKRSVDGSRGDYTKLHAVKTVNGWHLLFRPFRCIHDKDGRGISWHDDSTGKDRRLDGELKKNALTLLFAEVEKND